MTILPTHQYRDPLDVLIAKENAVEHRVKGCKGCARLNFDASGAAIIASCAMGRKVCRKGKCTLWKESE